MKVDKNLIKRIEAGIAKRLQRVKTNISFKKDDVENSGKLMLILKTDMKGNVGIGKVKKAAQVVFSKNKKHIICVYIHDAQVEEIAMVAPDGDWLTLE
jgi:hypothetical protein